ncbi:MAG: arsenate reductase [Gammaproteobacteria bacterium]|nr:arsenate reductase [Gammaproteobacteria bacterium]
MTTLYGIKNCDSVRKARKWLDANHVPYTFHDYREQGLTAALLADWCAKVGWQKLLNKRSRAWQDTDVPKDDDLDEHTAAVLMLRNPTLVKRPLLSHGDEIQVGFNEKDYRRLLGLQTPGA